MVTEEVLTADVSRVAKCSSNLWIQLDHEVTLLCKLIIAIFHLLRDPLSKVVTTQRIYHVYDPLPRQFCYISLIWQVQLELFRLSTVVKDSTDGEGLIHGNMEVLCVLRFEDYRYISGGLGYLHFFSPRTISLRKQMVTHSGAGRYALASIVRNWYTSYFDRNFAANSDVVTRRFSEVDIYMNVYQMKL